WPTPSSPDCRAPSGTPDRRPARSGPAARSYSPRWAAPWPTWRWLGAPRWPPPSSPTPRRRSSSGKA
ncbi:MAG: hypothetical protein AVDCRST_MAG40-515, partial [uncultured Gemmatimonadaceae bacterium]